MTGFFSGIATAVVTPMLEDGSIDFESYRKLIKFQLESGVDCLVVAGTTGEGSTLSIEEKVSLLKETLVLRGSQYNCKIVLGTGSNDTRKSIEATQIAKDNGADGVLLVTPYYNKTSQRGLVAHYKAINDAVDIPMIIYNVPGRTGMTIQPETVKELSTLENIVALKDATGSMQYMDDVKRLLGDSDFKLYSGDDGTFLDFLLHGGDGVISVVTNCLPEKFIELYKSFLAGDVKVASEIQFKLNPFIDSLFSDVSPTPVKACLKEMGYCEENFRLPLIPTTEQVKENVIRLYNEWR